MKLLLAEDEESLSRALVAILKHNHYNVDAVYDGEEALDYLTASHYDGIILDIMMPKKDGLEVLKFLRQRKDPTPALLLTAKSEIDDKVLGLDAGANDYLTKPFDTKELLARIWGYDSDTDLSVVWVYISYLRKKLAALNSDIQIKATSNMGYSLEEQT
ncbi:MAG: DNA-binding response regulator [Hungatella sp.]